MALLRGRVGTGPDQMIPRAARLIRNRFGTLKRRLGFGSRYVFHSIRKTVTTLLQQADVTEAVAAGILGHDIPTMTYGLYAEGASSKQKAEAIERIDYPL